MINKFREISNVGNRLKSTAESSFLTGELKINKYFVIFCCCYIGTMARRVPVAEDNFPLPGTVPERDLYLPNRELQSGLELKRMIPFEPKESRTASHFH